MWRRQRHPHPATWGAHEVADDGPNHDAKRDPEHGRVAALLHDRCRLERAHGISVDGQRQYRAERDDRGIQYGPGLSATDEFDAAGTAYVSNAPASGLHAITEYSSGSNGNVSPIRAISGSNTGLTGADGLFINASGDLYVANCTGCFQSSGTMDAVLEFAPGANGNVAPISTLSGPNTGLAGTTNLTFDAAGDLLVTSSTGAPGILIFAPGATGNVAPTSTISGSNTGISQPECVVVDSTGAIYVCNAAANTITVYAPGSSGNIAPVRTLGGSNTGLAGPTQLAFDSAENMYVADSGSASLTVYAPGANGNQAPLFTVTGSSTALNGPVGLAL
jgi:hypothetical protein